MVHSTKSKAKKLCMALLLVITGTAYAAPESLVQNITYNDQTITLRLTKQTLRGANFELLSQDSAGNYVTEVTTAERSYLGTVDNYPGAVSFGIQRDDGSFWGGVYFDRGATWYAKGDTVYFTRGLGIEAFTGYAYPTSPSVQPGQADNQIYGFDVAYDVDHDYFTQAGGVSESFQGIEFTLTALRALYMRDALVRPYLGRVVVRTSLEHDPYVGLNQGGYLGAVKTEWNTNHTDTSFDLVSSLSPTKIAGGLAWVGVVGGGNGMSVSASFPDGNGTVVARHELGHNWGCSHSVGGQPEGTGIMGGNVPARFSGCEVYKILSHRNSRPEGVLDNEGTYNAVNLPPYAAMDTARYIHSTSSPVTIDVLANDFDANGETLTIADFNTTSAHGGTISLVNGQLQYQPHPSFLGSDYFLYTIRDTSGQEATGVAVIKVELTELPYRSYTADGTNYTGSHATGAEGAYIWGMDVNPINNLSACDVDGNGVKDFHELGTTPVDPTDGKASNTDGIFFRTDYGDSPTRASNLEYANISYTYEMGLDIKPTGTEGSRGVFGLSLKFTNSTDYGRLMLDIGRNSLSFYGGVEAADVLDANAISQSNEGYHTWRIVYDQAVSELFIFRDGILLNKNGAGIPGITNLGNPTNTYIGKYTNALAGDWALDYLVIDTTDAYGYEQTNYAPIWKNSPVVANSAMINMPYSDQLTDDVVDFNNDVLTFTKVSGPDWLSVQSNGTIQGTPTLNEFGQNQWVISASDGVHTTEVDLTILVQDQGLVMSEDFAVYDVENPADFSIDGQATGNWTNSNSASNASRIFNTSNFGGTRLWISNVNGASITSQGIDTVDGAEYTLDFFAACEAGLGTAEGTLSYDILVGQSATSATTVINGPQTVTVHGDGWQTANSKSDHRFSQNFAVPALTSGDQIFLRFTRVGSSTGSWIGLDDIALTMNRVKLAPSFSQPQIQLANATEDVYYQSNLAELAEDPNSNDQLTFTKVSGPSWLSVSTAGLLSGTATNDEVGSHNLTVRVTDSDGLSDEANVLLSVINTNDAPIAEDDTAVTTEDVAIVISVLDNDHDIDLGDTLTISNVSVAAFGSVTIQDNQLLYTPDADFNGSDSFSYTVSDGTATATAMVTVTVTAVNDAPVAVNDTVSVNEDSAIEIDLLGNDFDVDGDSLTIQSVSSPANGTTVRNGDRVTYTPAANYNGVDQFTYTISDGVETAVATVSVTVNAVNDAPVASDDKAFTVADQAVTLDVLSNDNDLDGDSLIISSFTQGAKGSVDQVGNQLVYTPLADFTVSDSFTYTISDENGGNAVATVNIYDSNLTIDFEGSQGFAEQSGMNDLVTTEDLFGTVWHSADSAAIWNRSDIPPVGVQCLMLDSNESCQFQISEVYNGVQSLSFDYASFSSGTNTAFTVWYDRLDGNGWQQAWSTQVTGMVPAWNVKPWPQINVELNLDGPVILLFQTAGSRGVLIDTVTVTPQP